MGVELVKSISLRPKENKIYITSASSNCFPKEYIKWEYGKDGLSFHEKMLQLVRSINSRTLTLNKSLYEWNYAEIKADEEMKAKYGKEFDLYDWSSMKYDIYCLGEQVSSIYKEITQEELDKNKLDYELDYEGKGYKLYYKKSIYEKEEERTRAILEEYLGFFEHYLKEKKDGEYYLYSDKYGYVSPKGTNGAFYYNQNGVRLFNETLSYKKAYCLAYYIGRDIKVMKVPKREYVPTSEQVEEAKKRLESLGMDKKYQEDLYFSKYFESCKAEDFYPLLEKVNEIEKEFECYVYYVIYSSTEFGELYSFLYVSKDNTTWEEDNDMLTKGENYAYVWNKTDDMCSEFGIIGIKKDYNLLKRTF